MTLNDMTDLVKVYDGLVEITKILSNAFGYDPICDADSNSAIGRIELVREVLMRNSYFNSSNDEAGISRESWKVFYKILDSGETAETRAKMLLVNE